jgi:hypothetical protein
MSSHAAVECVTATAKESHEKNSIEITMEEPENKLNDEQKKVIKIIYEKSKNATESVLKDPKIDPTIKVTQTLAQIIKIVEYVKINDKKIVGSSKKQIVIYLGRLVMNEVLEDNEFKQHILSIYDLVAEQTLETIIDVSHVVNTKVQEATNSCLDWLFSLCGKK